ncbi:anthranilate phosphoribosyltransferase family protein [Calothrix sp. 336/3]|uniref:anthranilate phosphoribosyltransferase family protein n=1 Tax=Calothrix sp. 336/3 TaxID=1337936 RepID=UPI0004E43A1D|nr:anthranilate phosphoribosyltransferase family protein [Calothrix sp. 336/3]AKG22960.1 hypothetical protein IJ00_18250 [Calothrix sp. 336/3]
METKNKFRDLLKKVGSGSHTSQNLTREEAATATKMMLLGEATPAQIGAFLIAHRIKRPTGEELAGMLDAYDELGVKAKLQAIDYSSPVVVLGIPYDGRTRTAPVSPIIALLLATVGQPVIMHGGDRLPTKYGLPLVEIWRDLGVDWTKLTISQTQAVFENTSIGFVYTPQHFPLTQSLWEYRDQLGKRPPLATMELIWCPYSGDAHQIVGFVHPPTEGMFQSALQLKGVKELTTVKGLEGSCDLPRDRTAIIGLGLHLERLHLTPRDFGITNKNVPLESQKQLATENQLILQGIYTELMDTVLWNAGFYFWRAGIYPDIASGIIQSLELLNSGAVLHTLKSLQKQVDS